VHGHLGERHAVEGDAQRNLTERQQADHEQRRRSPGDHHGGERHRDQERQERLVALFTRQRSGQDVVHDLDGRVDDVQQIAEGPDGGLGERDAAPGRGLDEAEQPAGGAVP
jgi:hypothetical protein